MEFTLLEVFILQKAMEELHESTKGYDPDLIGVNAVSETEILRKLAVLNRKYAETANKVVLVEKYN